MRWKLLKLSSSASSRLPPLLIATNLGPSSYTIQLTDLVNIWSESLSRTQIIRRSLEENIIADLSSSDQLSILLSKLGQALTGESGTTLCLTVGDEITPSQAPSLILHACIDLAKGTSALEWPVRLSAMPAAFLTSQLTLPLLTKYYHATEDLNILSQMLNEKDQFIEKLLEKLEEAGIEPGHVFPRIIKKQGTKPNKKIMIHKVKGLNKFDVESWKSHRETMHDPKDITSTLNEVFCEELIKKLDIGVGISPEKENWWEHVKGAKINIGVGKAFSESSLGSAQKPQLKQNLRNRDSSDSDEDAFETATAPPKVSNRFTSKSVASPHKKSLDHADENTMNYSEFTPGKRFTKFLWKQESGVVSKTDAEPIFNDDLLTENSFTPARPPEKYGIPRGEGILRPNAPHHVEDKSTALLSIEPSTITKKSNCKLGILKGKKPNPVPPSESKGTGPSTDSVDKTPSALPPVPVTRKPKLGIIVGKKIPTAVSSANSPPSVASVVTAALASEVVSTPLEQSLGTLINRDKNIESKISIGDDRERAQVVETEREETAIERANRKRAESRREIGLRMHDKNMQKKKRCF